jgi:hypothetical protein
MYVLGLQHLSPEEMQTAFEESIRKCKFFPSVAEMLECLKAWEDRQPMQGTAAPYEPFKEDPAEAKALWKKQEAEFMAGMHKPTTGIAGAKATREPGED